MWALAEGQSDPARSDVVERLRQALQDNLNFLRGILEQASAPGGQRDAVTQKIGDFYAACIDETAVEKHGIEPIKSDLDRIAALKTAHDLAPLLANLHTTLGSRALLSPADPIRIQTTRSK